MSVRVMADVWDFGPNDPVDNSVLLCLANYCNDQGRQCFPSIDTVSKKVRRSVRTVSRSIRQLEAGKWLTVERGVGKGKTSQYVIDVERLKTGQSVAFTESKGDSGDIQKVTPTTSKGDSGDIPPHPLKGVTINEPPKEPSSPSASLSVAEQEESIYQIYPRKVGKEAAIKAIQKAVIRLVEKDKKTALDVRRFLYAKTKAYANSPAGQPPPHPADDYRPHPATWFNRGRYYDDLKEWNKPNGVNSADLSKPKPDPMAKMKFINEASK